MSTYFPTVSDPTAIYATYTSHLTPLFPTGPATVDTSIGCCVSCCHPKEEKPDACCSY